MSIAHFSGVPASDPPIQVLLTDQDFVTYIVNEEAAVNMNVLRDGDFNAYAINGGPFWPVNGQWYAGQPRPAPGDEAWVRLTKTSGDDPTGPALAVWLPLSSNRTWVWGPVLDDLTVFGGDLEIAADPAGLQIVGSCEIDVSVTSIIDVGGA